MKLDRNFIQRKDPDLEIRDAMDRAQIMAPASIVKDGTIHRFHANADKSMDNDSGWYVFFDGDYVAGAFGDWSRDVTVRFQSSGITEMTTEQRAEYDRLVEEAKQAARDKREKVAQDTAFTAARIWENLPPAPADHPYLQKKGLKGAYGARIQGEELVIPVMDMDGKVWSLQNISASGEKRYMSGGAVDGHFWVVGHGQPVYMAEGMATAASIYEATGQPVVVAYNAHNLVSVSKLFPSVTIVADNDESGTGERYARQTDNPVRLIPVKGMDANDYVCAGHDLKAFLQPMQYQLVTLRDALSDVKPPQWLIKGWIPKGNSFGMNFGASGNGKTFVIIDEIMCISTGKPWHGRAVNQGRCIYLCGEGLGSVLDRLKCWVQQNGVEPGLWPYISEGATDIDTPDGFNNLCQAVEALGDKPDLVVIDTLNRFMKGDENDTKAATGFIQACKRLQDLWNCCVMLVHHTGLSEDAQNRSRGSSAFKGALDFQHMTEKRGECFTITQTKVKRGRTQDPITLQLEDHQIGYDEDGNEVTSAILTDNVEEVPKTKPETQQKDEALMTDIFTKYGFVIMGKPYVTHQNMKEAVIESKKDNKDPEEAARKAMVVRKVITGKPSLLERLVSYGDIDVEYEKDGRTAGYFANSWTMNGVLEPDFSMAVQERIKAISETAETKRKPNGN